MIVVPYAHDPSLILTSRHMELLSADGQTRRPAGALKGKPTARGLIVKIPNVTTREAAADLRGWRLGLERRHLPAPADDEIYWADLPGLEVFTPEGRSLGRVFHLMEAGAGLLLVVRDPREPDRDLLLPMREEFLVSLDLAAGRLVLDLPDGLLDL